jgi:predicted acyltransferase
MTYVLLGTGWMGPIYQVGFAGWMTPRFGPCVPSLAFALAFVGVWWLVVRLMDRQGWYLKV